MTTIKPGDRVRTKGASTYPDGTEFTVVRVIPHSHGGLGPEFTHHVTGDPKGYGVWTQFLELVADAEAQAALGAELVTMAHQLGLTDEQAPGALEEGAKLLALGLTPEEIREARQRIIAPTYWDSNTSLKSQHVAAATLRALQERIGKANAAKGFHEEGDSLRARIEGLDVPGYLRNYYTARLALIITEVAEAIEELRNGRQVDETYYSGGLVDFSPEGGEDQVSVDLSGAPRKPEGVPSEIADVVIRAFDFAHEAGIDLAQIIEEKLAYNATRAHKHGRTF